MMLIRHGFLRDMKGTWHNLLEISYIQVRASSWSNKAAIICYFLDQDSTTLNEYESTEEAYTALDKLFNG
jgi:hypothetical protein